MPWPRSVASATGRTRRWRWRHRRGATTARASRARAPRARSASTPRPACCIPGASASRAAGDAGRGWCATALSAACDWADVGAAGGPGSVQRPEGARARQRDGRDGRGAGRVLGDHAHRDLAGRTRATRATRGATNAGSEAWWASVARARCSRDLTAETDRRLAASELLVAAALELAADQRGALRAAAGARPRRARRRGARPARRPRRPTARRRAAREAAGPSASRRGSSRGSGCARWRTSHASTSTGTLPPTIARCARTRPSWTASSASPTSRPQRDVA